MLKLFLDREDVREREAILQWLSPLDFHEKQRTTYAKYHEGTAQWLLQDDVFQNWHAGKENLTLWCAGDGLLFMSLKKSKMLC